MVEMSRDDELSATSAWGANPQDIRLMVLMSCGLRAIGGALYAAQTGFVDPDVAVLSQTNFRSCDGWPLTAISFEDPVRGSCAW